MQSGSRDDEWVCRPDVGSPWSVRLPTALPRQAPGRHGQLRLRSKSDQVLRNLPAPRPDQHPTVQQTDCGRVRHNRGVSLMHAHHPHRPRGARDHGCPSILQIPHRLPARMGTVRSQRPAEESKAKRGDCTQASCEVPYTPIGYESIRSITRRSASWSRLQPCAKAYIVD
jgi:hypothetical protein